jgi:hypothetical protein
LLCCGLALSQDGTPIRQASEEEVKAAFLLNFLRFVEWTAARPEAGPTFSICIAGADPFGGALRKAVAGEQIEGRPIVIQFVRRWQNGCRAFFVGAVDVDPAPLLAGVDPGVLTVGEGTSFLRDGGMIAFIMENRRVRFDVNLQAAQRGSVRLRSQLLDVARRVER